MLAHGLLQELHRAQLVRHPYYVSVLRSSPDRIVPMEEGKEVGSYKFSAGFQQRFPANVETLNEEELHTRHMTSFEELRYYPLVIKLVSFSICTLCCRNRWSSPRWSSTLWPVSIVRALRCTNSFCMYSRCGRYDRSKSTCTDLRSSTGPKRRRLMTTATSSAWCATARCRTPSFFHADTCVCAASARRSSACRPASARFAELASAPSSTSRSRVCRRRS